MISRTVRKRRTRAGAWSRLIAAAIAVSIAYGCAGQGSADRSNARASSASAPSRSDCLINRSLRNYTLLDDQNLVIYGIGNQPYHIVLATPALDLGGEFSLGVLDRDRDGRICPFGGDAILVDGPLFERIPIRSIERIDRDRVEILKIDFGITEPPEGEFVVTPLE